MNEINLGNHTVGKDIADKQLILPLKEFKEA